MLVYGAIFAVSTFVIFTLLGAFASRLSKWLLAHPKVTVHLNTGAGMTLIGAGLLILSLRTRAAR